MARPCRPYCMSGDLESVEFNGWPCVRLTSGELEGVVGAFPGGRLLSLRVAGQELLYVDRSRAGEQPPSVIGDLRAFKRGFGFPLWGGDKTWIAPQAAWWEAMPPLELDSGRYDLEKEGPAVRLRSRPCPETGLVVERRLEFGPASTISLEESIENTSSAPIRRGIWNVTQLLRPARVWLPVEKGHIRPYPEEGQSEALASRVIDSCESFSGIVCEEALHFKYGAVPREGQLLTMFQGEQDVLMLRRFAIDQNAKAYAHGSAVEVYNSPTLPYLEVEVHAPLRELQPGERQTARQDWSFCVVARGKEFGPGLFQLFPDSGPAG